MRHILVSITLVLIATVHVSAEEEDCVFAVDVDFDDTRDHNYCNKDSRLNNLLNGMVKGGETSPEDKQAVTTYEAVPEEQLEEPARVTERTLEHANAGVVFNIREPFARTGGPQPALKGLYAQMVTHCPMGWEKLKEWAVPAEAGYFLHYQFRCAQ